MQHIMRNTFAALSLSILLAACADNTATEPGAVATPTPMFTNQPEIEDLKFPWSYETDCGAFTDQVVGKTDVRFWTFFDKNGTPITFKAQFVFDVTHTHSVTGNVLSDDGQGTFTLDLLTGIGTSTGTGYHTTDQGRGLILALAGRQISDENGVLTFIAGLYPAGDPDWCALL